MRVSPSGLALFFPLVSIVTSHPLSPMDKVTHASNLVNLNPPSNPLFFPNIPSLSLSHLPAAFLTHNLGENPRKQGPIQCNIARLGYENFAIPWRIKQEEDYLSKKEGDFLLKSLQTEVVSCSFNCAISVMNTVRYLSLPFLLSPLHQVPIPLSSNPPLHHHLNKKKYML